MEATVARIDERTASILDTVKKQNSQFAKHEERDREDFRALHARISSTRKDAETDVSTLAKRVSGLERWRMWTKGITAAVAFLITSGIGAAKFIFGLI